MKIDVGKYTRGDLLIVGYSTTFQGRLSVINFDPKTSNLNVTFEHLAEKKFPQCSTGSEGYKLWNLDHRMDGYTMSFTIKSAKEIKPGLTVLTADTGETLTLIPRDHGTMLLPYEIMFRTMSKAA